MKSTFYTLLLLFVGHNLQAQSLGGENAFGWAMAGIAVIIFLVVVSNLASNLISIEAHKRGVSMSKDDFSIFSGISGLFKKKVSIPDDADSMHVLGKGYDIKLEGEADRVWLDRDVKTFALRPKDYVGMVPIPKVMVEPGQDVLAGTPVFYDKRYPEILHVSPISGEYIELKRGAKRSINELVFLADKDQKAVKHEIPVEDRSAYIELLKKSGGWTLLRQRPFDVLPDPEVTPKNIFITTFDTAPLAPDNNFIIEGQGANFQKGLDVLNTLTDGKVYLGLDAKSDVAVEFKNATGVVRSYFHGRHPAGNVGVQIHHTAPLSNGDVVWYLNLQDVLTLGNLFNTGMFVPQRTVALTGAELSQTGYVKTRQGASIKDLLGSDINEGIRYISGDVLSGSNNGAEGYVGMWDDQVTAIEEGDDYEMFGWLLPLKGRPSVSGTFPNKLFPDLKYKPSTNTHGERRAFVVTGEYEKLLPMDIHVQPLMKAILNNDFERMEGLGLFELSEEDIALCEFACTSKQPLQNILREGLDVLREQG